MESGDTEPVVVRAPDAAIAPDDDEGGSDLFGDEDGEEDYQRSFPAMSEDEGLPEEGSHSVGFGHGPTAFAGEGDLPTGRAVHSGHGSVARKVEEVPESLAERLCRVDLCELFSPPRVGLQAKKFGLAPGDAMDLTTGWDLKK